MARHREEPTHAAAEEDETLDPCRAERSAAQAGPVVIVPKRNSHGASGHAAVAQASFFKGSWRRVDDADVGTSAKVVSEDVWRAAFSDTPPLPQVAFQ